LVEIENSIKFELVDWILLITWIGFNDKCVEKFILYLKDNHDQPF